MPCYRHERSPVFFLMCLIILTIFSISQLLVIHNGHWSNKIQVHNNRRLELELRELEISLHSMLMKRVPTTELNKRILQNQINSKRFMEIIREASTLDHKTTDYKSDGYHNKSSYVATGNNVGFLTTFDSISQTDTTAAQCCQYTTNLGGKLVSIGIDKIPRSDQQNSSCYCDNIQQDPVVTNSPLTYCPEIPDSLEGNLHVNLSMVNKITLSEVLESAGRDVRLGGQWWPAHCQARHKVTIIIPYRDRHTHLLALLYTLHPMLQRQQLAYRVVVVEQNGTDVFNKAMLMNIAFVESQKLSRAQCVIFHDVDLVPEDDRNMYSCPPQPRHLSVGVDQMNYKLAYAELVGGVLNMRAEHFLKVNGFSNLYWGWGAEDDDMAYRIFEVGLKITRPPATIARYKMLPHTKRAPADWRKRTKLLLTGPPRYKYDGLNSLRYQLLHIKLEHVYTHILVDIGKAPGAFT